MSFPSLPYVSLARPQLRKVTLFGGEGDRYVEAACHALGIPASRDPKKVYHYLGNVSAEHPKVLDAVVGMYPTEAFDYTDYLEARSKVYKISQQIDALIRHEHDERGRYEEYDRKMDHWVHSESKAQAPSYRPKLPPPEPSDQEKHFAAIYSREFTPDPEGYMEYLLRVDLGLWKLLATMEIPLYKEEDYNQPHGYILGTPGSGKSELLKVLTHTFVEDDKYGAVVVLDPSSQMVREIASWKEFNTGNRLVYLRPFTGLSPVINPFEISGVDADDYSEKALSVKRVVAQELTEALARIAADSVTGNMKMLLRNCVLALLDRPGATLNDLLKFMNDDPEMISWAGSLRHHEHIADYFSEGRFKKANNTTKDAIGRRLDGLLSMGPFKRFTCGPSTLDLEDAIKRRKVILFDLGKGVMGDEEGSALGKLVIAMILGMAFRRRGEKVPCTLVVDECHNYITESMEEILMEARKYKISLLLAQQTAGQRMPVALKDAVLVATNLQVVGATPRSGASRNADLLGVSAEEVRTLGKGEFFVRPDRAGDVVKFQANPKVLGRVNSVTKPTFKRIVAEQIRKYYRSTINEPTYVSSLGDENPDEVPESSQW